MSRTSQNDVSAAGCQSSLSFTQGFILGQLSVVLLISAFIKFFIFGEAPSPPSRGLAGRAAAHRRSYSINQNSPEGSSLRKKPSTSNVLRPVPSSSTNTRSILRKTYYNAVPTHVSTKNGRHRMHHSTHQPESLDWFNVLTAQTIAQYRQTAYLLKDSPTSSILDSLSAALNNPEKKPSFIDTIKVTDVSLGEEFPIFSNCRVIAVDDPNTDGGRLQALMDVDLSDDNLSLALETSIILNYPKPRSAILPVALSVSVVRFSGTLCISLIPASTPDAPTSSSGTQNPDARTAASGLQFDPRGNGRDTNNDSSTETPPKKGVPKTNLAFSFLPDYRLDLSVRSLIGSRTRLQDVPKVAQLIEARVHAWFEERVVEPRVQVVGLPDFWPRMGRTGVRAGEDAEAGAAATAAAAAAAAATSRPSGGPSHEHGRHGSEGLPEGLRYRGPSSSEYGYDSSNRSSGMFRMEDERQHDRPEREFEIPGSMPTP